MQKYMTKNIKFALLLMTSFVLLLHPIFSQNSVPTLPQVTNPQQQQNISHLAKVHPLVLRTMLTSPDKKIQVIVSKNSDINTLEEQISPFGKAVANFDFINAVVIEIKSGQIGNLAKLNSVNFIVLNQQSTLSNTDQNKVNYSSLTNAYNFSINAHRVWEHGIDGSGVTVAVIDSGISKDTSDFDGRIVKNIEFNSNSRTVFDQYGHGTHVAAIIGGNGNESHGKYIGIAPGVNLINVKFSSHDGSGSEADLIRALQWVYDNRKNYNIRVANISSSISQIQSYKESAVAAAVEQLWFAGVVVVVSAGNDGKNPCSTCHAPANDPYVITVGTVDDHGTRDLRDDYFKPWSSHGFTLDGHKKPEVLAPGVNIISYMPNGYLRNIAPDRIVNGKYFKMSGTSMSAPVVSGVVALMLQENPHLTPDQVKWIISHTTRPYYNQSRQSPGVINAAKAVFYTGPIGNANRGLVPSPFIDLSTKRILKNNMSWSNMSWSNMSWSNHLR
jgi:serine protease AprX